MKKTREYQASQILKRKLLKKFLWLARVNTFVKWSVMLLLVAGIIYFSLVYSGTLFPDKRNNGTNAWSQILFAKSAFHWPLIVTFVYMLGVFLESVLSWEAKRRQNRGFQSAGFANLDLVVKRTKIRIGVQVLTIVVAAILFGWWFHIITSIHPNTGRLIFDSNLTETVKDPITGADVVVNRSIYEIRVFGALFISMTVILMTLSLAYIIAASVMLFKTRRDVIMYNQIKGIAIDSLLEQVDTK